VITGLENRLNTNPIFARLLTLFYLILALRHLDGDNRRVGRPHAPRGREQIQRPPPHLSARRERRHRGLEQQLTRKNWLTQNY